MNTVSYVARLSYCEDGICVTFPDIPGVNTCGETKEEAVEMAKDALECWFSDGTPLPVATRLDEIKRNPQLRCDSVLVDIEQEAEFIEVTANLD